MSNLILFTNRSGSTILSDIVAFNDQSVNLGEGLHSLARDYNYNSQANKNTSLYREFSAMHLSRKHHNQLTRGSDHIGFFEGKQKRISILKQSNESWTVKENLEKVTLDIPFIDYCIENDVKVFITHRKDLRAQFISIINARYRLEIAKHPGQSNFIFTNNDKTQQYSEMRIPFDFLYMYMNVFLEQLMIWKIIYEKYKNKITLVSYEDVIQPLNFESIGIDNTVIEKYKQQTQYLVPTPHNTDKVVIVDDNKNIGGAWEQALFLIDRHRYLVEL